MLVVMTIYTLADPHGGRARSELRTQVVSEHTAQLSAGETLRSLAVTVLPEPACKKVREGSSCSIPPRTFLCEMNAVSTVHTAAIFDLDIAVSQSWSCMPLQHEPPSI